MHNPADYSEPVVRCLFTIEAEFDPQTPARVLGLISQTNKLPASFSSQVMAPDLIRIVMELKDYPDGDFERLGKRIANIPSVLGVSRTIMSLRQNAKNQPP